MRAPDTVVVGTALMVVAERADAPDGMSARLVAQGSYGPLLYRGTFQGGRAEFRIPAEDTHVAGLVTLTVQADAAQGQATLSISPGPPVDPVTPLVGPRTLIADGTHWGTAVAIPFDAYGNPVAEGTRVQFQLQRPDGVIERFSAPVTHLLAWKRIFSATHAGRTTITTVAGSAHGPEASLNETPGWPASFRLSASPLGLPADGHQLVTLRTQPISDAYGNQMLDGTLVTFVVRTPNGEPRFIPAYTIDGVAEAQLQAPSQPGIVSIRATLYGIESAPLWINFAPGPAVGAIPLRASVDADQGIVRITVGPLLGSLGQLVPEGTQVQITLSGPDAHPRSLTALSEDGRAEVRVRLAALAAGEYQVEVSAGAGTGQTSFSVP